MFGQYWGNYGLWFMFSLVLALWAVFHTVQSNKSPISKAIWCVLVLFLPFFGFALWLFFGPRSARARG
jgi:hypothetical protein